jgi:hypothetical protein
MLFEIKILFITSHTNLFIFNFYDQALFLHCNAICIWPPSQSTACQYHNLRQIFISACEQPFQVSYGYLLFLIYCRLVIHLIFVLSHNGYEPMRNLDIEHPFLYL